MINIVSFYNHKWNILRHYKGLKIVQDTELCGPR